MMFRRKFIQKVTCAVAVAGPAAARGVKTVTYQIEGFTCVTCAVGLDTMLRDQKGIVGSQSSYADKRSKVEFDPQVTTEGEIRDFIRELGFRAS
jgi:copper chaperone CopZ